MFSRRDLCLAAVAPLASQATARMVGGSPFPLGVASGEPDDSSVVLWTRLAPRPLEPNGGMPDHRVQVRWRLWRHNGQLAGEGAVSAEPQHAHCVHVLARHLAPNTGYFYQFDAGGQHSAIGATRTLPSPTSDTDSLCFATVCCQNYTHGRFTGYRALLDSRPEFILHLGDYIYEVDFDGTARRHPPGGPPRTLTGFRQWHAYYKMDPDLAAAHAAVPFFCSIDNHDAVVDGGLEHSEVRQAAYRAWAENMPVRIAGSLAEWAPVSRGLAWGKLLHFELMETRRYRAAQDVCATAEGVDPGFGLYRRPCDEHLAAGRRMLHEEDERRVLSRLSIAQNLHSWIALVSSVPIAALPLFAGSRVYAASWDAYPEARRRLLAVLGPSRSAGVVGLSGDIHAGLINELKIGDERIGFDLVTPSLTSDCPKPLATPLAEMRGPEVHFCQPHLRGFTIHRVSKNEWHADFFGRPTADCGRFSTTCFTIAKTTARSPSLDIRPSGTL